MDDTHWTEYIRRLEDSGSKFYTNTRRSCECGMVIRNETTGEFEPCGLGIHSEECGQAKWTIEDFNNKWKG